MGLFNKIKDTPASNAFKGFTNRSFEGAYEPEMPDSFKMFPYLNKKLVNKPICNRLGESEEIEFEYNNLLISELTNLYDALIKAGFSEVTNNLFEKNANELIYQVYIEYESSNGKSLVTYKKFMESDYDNKSN